jgi:hypothetical protein
MGYRFDRGKLLTSVGLEMLDILGNPKKTLERLARRFRRKVSSGLLGAMKRDSGMTKRSNRLKEDVHA